MGTQTIDAGKLASMFLCGAKRLEAQKDVINELNVFPVPDGDTGTNMSLTIRSAADEIRALSEIRMPELCKAISSGSLRGARGNSGVILSQLFRGFTKTVKDAETIDIALFAAAFMKAQETAYKAVMKPKEGTILTVAREIAEKAQEIAETTDDMDSFFSTLLTYGQEVLEKTPEMLPVLKEAGVVDSGGQGLMEVLRGGYDHFCGRDAEEDYEPAAPAAVSEAESLFTYRTGYKIVLEHPFSKEEQDGFRGYLLSIGDQVKTDLTGNTVSVDLSTNDPGLAVQKGLSYGTLHQITIENSKGDDLPEKETQEPAERKDTGFIAISAGEGLNGIFTELGVDCVVTGGQTMNPSTEDILSAVASVNADHIFILPNNKNIILAANQARDLTEDKELIVIPTKTIPQGITAMINHMPGESAADNEAAMTESISAIRTGQVTYAVRDTQISGMEIHEGDFMGIGDEGILSVGKECEQVTMELVGRLTDEDSELISLYYGADTNEETAENLAEEIRDRYPDCDVECHSGGQPVYRYLLSVE